MRLLAATLALLLSLGPAAVAGAVEEMPELPATPPVESRTAELDALFEILRTARSDAGAVAAENGILAIWLQSGSDTVDLLMTWTLAAMEAKDYPAALDFLDRITQMKPDFVEGWNKRATVYYLTDD